MPRNKAKNPTHSGSGAARAGNICWDAQKPSKISRMPGHQAKPPGAVDVPGRQPKGLRP